MKAELAIFMAAIGLGMVASGESRAATVSVTPVADSYIKEPSPFGSPNTPPDEFATGATAAVNIQSYRMRGLMRFDLGAAIPAGAIVRSVSLSIRVTKKPVTGAENSSFELRRVLQDWDETNVSWSERNTGIQWGTPGALGLSDLASESSAVVQVRDLGAYTFATSSVLVSDVQGWVDSPGTNFGWMIRSQSEGVPRTVRFIASRESSTVSNRPTLTIDFDVPAAAPTLTLLPVANGELRFSFPAESNRAYVVEGRTAFGAGAWEDVLTLPASPAATVLTVTNSILGGAKFFRVRTP